MIEAQSTEVEPIRPAATDRWRTVRRLGFVVYFILVLLQLTVGLPTLNPGLPLSPIIVMGWLGLASAIWSIGRDRRELLLALLGWGSLAVAVRFWTVTRGFVDNWWGNPQPVPGHLRTIPQQSLDNAKWVTSIDRFLGFGNDPSAALQRRLYIRNDDDAPYWEILTSLVYISHFFVVYAVAVVQWIRNRIEWLRWILTLSTLLVFGVLLYLLVPLAPPWLAGPAGLTDSTARVGTRALSYLQLDAASNLWKKGAAGANEVAAFPSLHLGFTVLVSAYFWKSAPTWLKGVLVLYPLTMSFSLVYSGEHYIVDCIAGALLAIFVVWFTRWVERMWKSRQPLNRYSSSADVNSSESSSASIG